MQTVQINAAKRSDELHQWFMERWMKSMTSCTEEKTVSTKSRSRRNKPKGTESTDPMFPSCEEDFALLEAAETAALNSQYDPDAQQV